MSSIENLLKIMATLRDPEKGCPWDRAQTMSSIVPHTLEEAYELGYAIEQGQEAEIKNECADLLWQIIFYSQIAKEENKFDFDDVVAALEHKLIKRHPHVFGNEHAPDSQAVSKLWEQIKDEDRDRLLADIPANLPSLSRAQKVQKRAGTVGFEWDDIEGVLAKIEEEIQEVRDALKEAPERAQEECGDLLFAVTNLARWLDADAEQLLRQATDKFIKRFNRVESSVLSDEKPWQGYTLAELEALWQQAKRELASG